MYVQQLAGVPTLSSLPPHLDNWETNVLNRNPS